MTQTLTWDQIGPFGTGAVFSNAAPASPAIRNNGRAFIGLGNAHNQSADGRARSTSNLAIGTGLRTFSGLTLHNPATEAAWLARFAENQRVRVYNSENRWMEGRVVTRTFASITIDVDTFSGSGSFADWYISPVAGGSWLQMFDTPSGSLSIWDNYEDQARLASVSNFGIALSGASRTQGGEAVGVAGVVVSLGDWKAWGGYFDALVTSTTAHVTHGLEANITSLVASQLRGVTPYNRFTTRMAGAANIAIGSGLSDRFTGASIRSFAVDWGLLMQGNNGCAHVGIVMRSGFLRRKGEPDDTSAPGNVGYGEAISLASEYGISWYSRDALIVSAGSFVVGQTYIIQSVGTTNFTLIGATSNAVGVQFTATGEGVAEPGAGTASLVGSQAEVVRLFSSVTNPALRWRANFSDGAFSIDEGVAPGNSLFRVNYRSDGNAFVAVTAGGAGAAPQIEAGGVAPNINLLARGKGTGRFGFGTFTASSDVPVIGHVEIVTTDGVVRKLAVVA